MDIGAIAEGVGWLILAFLVLSNWLGFTMVTNAGGTFILRGISTLQGRYTPA